MEEPKEPSQKEFSLLHPMAMGGINGGDGYTFQERYIVCHIPLWLKDPRFSRIMYEATGDVDVVYSVENNDFYDHIQVKDHNVTLGKLKEVIEGFVIIDNGTKCLYRKFILTSLSISSDVKSLAESLKRYRDAEAFYAEDDREKALGTTKTTLLEKIKDLGLESHSEFILAKMEFEVGKFDFNDNGVCKKMFFSTLVEHPKYKEHVAEIVSRVYARLIEEVLAHRGKPLVINHIETLIADTLTNPEKLSKDTVLHFHNWSQELFDPPASITLDWSHFFDRESRTIPDAEKWNNELIPQLQKTRKELAKTTTNRHIIFRGKCTLSSSIALGLTFPEVGNWTFELIQPPQTSTWRSDAKKIENYSLAFSENIMEGADELAVVFNITGRATPDVSLHLSDNAIAVKALVVIEPPKTPGNFSIRNDSEAVSLAGAAKDIIKKMVERFGAKKIHLFYFGPAALAIFLGQKLTALGVIQLYEFQDPGYKASCMLKS